MTHGLPSPQHPDGGPVSMAGNLGAFLRPLGAGAVPSRSELSEPEHPGGREGGEGPTSRAADRAHLKELASIYGGKCRVNGVGTEVCNAWRDFTAAVDRLVGDE